MGLITGSGSFEMLPVRRGSWFTKLPQRFQKPMDRGAWWANPWGCKESDTTEHKHLILFLMSTNGKPFWNAGFLKRHLSQFPQADCRAAPSLKCPGDHPLDGRSCQIPQGAGLRTLEMSGVCVSLNHCLCWTCFPCIWLKGPPPGVRSKGLQWAWAHWQWLLLLVTSSTFGVSWWTRTPIWQAAFQKLIQI